MITFTVPNEPVSLNVSLNQHWSERSKRNKRLKDTIFALAWNAGWRKDWKPFKNIWITIIGGKMDRDNSIAGCKPIIDALWHNDIIKDDNPDEVTIRYSFIEGKDKAVRVELK